MKLKEALQLPSVFKTLFFHTYKFCRSKVFSNFFDKATIKPLMKYREHEIIEEILLKLKPRRCLEWGAGYSTTWFPNLLTKDSTWITIEHEKEWATKIQNKNKNSNVKIIHKPPNHSPWTDENQDGSYSDLKDYVDYPSKQGEFDFILVDGRARTDCLRMAHELITDKGIVILHDSNRRYYHEIFGLYKYQVLFKDYREGGGGVWVASKGAEIDTVLNVDMHRHLWRVYNIIGRIIKGV